MSNWELPIHKDIVSALSHLSDEQRLDCVGIHDPWMYPKEYSVGDYVEHEGLLYKCRTAHTSQESWSPDVSQALWEGISHEPGTREHPIPYNNNMSLEEGKYYSQNELVYLCTRSTGVPVYNDLKDLVGIYVEEVSNT